MTDKEKILEKLKKLLALSKSDNPHEAALALQRAQKLMLAYNITQADLALSDIDESISDYWAAGSVNPPRYMLGLLDIIQVAFGVKSIIHYMSIISVAQVKGVAMMTEPANLIKVAQMASHLGIHWSRTLECLIAECHGRYEYTGINSWTIYVPADRVEEMKALVLEITPVIHEFNVEGEDA